MKIFLKFLIVWWTTINLPLPVTSSSVTTVSPIAEEFRFKSFVVGITINTTKLAAFVPKLKSMEKSFRELIVGSFQPDRTGMYNASQYSTITMMPIDSYTDLSTIKEISALVSLTDCSETYLMNEKLTAKYGPIIHIAITEPGCPRLDTMTGITVPLANFRYSDEVHQLFVDLRHDRLIPNWDSVTIIHDVYTGADTLNAALHAFSNNRKLRGVSVVIFKAFLIHSERQMEEVFRKLNNKEGNFVVITPIASIDSTLSLAKRMNLLQHSMQWIFVSPDAASISTQWEYVQDRIIADGVNLAFITNQTIGRGTYVIQLLNHLQYEQLFCDLNQMFQLLTQTVESFAADEYNAYIQVSDEEWDLIKKTRIERVGIIVKNMTENIDDLIQEGCLNTYVPQWKFDAAEHGRLGKRVFDVGKWQMFKGLQLTDQILPHVLGGFRGRTIKVASMHYPPWQIFGKNQTTGRPTYSGLVFEMLNHMSDSLNFSYQVIQPQDGGGWGTEKFDGTWNGLMRLVINEEVILGAGAFTIRPEKAKVVNFTMIFEREAYTFMVNRPSELSRVLLFAEPFTTGVWWCIGAALLIVGPTLYLINFNSPFYAPHQKFNKRGLFQLKNCFLYVYGALLQQGGSLLPDALSSRMLIGFWWLFVLTAVTSYSGNLVAFLTFPKVETSVNTIKDISQYRGVSSWGFLMGSVIESYLRASNKTVMMKLFSKGIQHPTLNETVLNKVRWANHAYIDWKIALLIIMKEQYMLKGRCEFVLGKEEIFEEQIAMVVPRSSPYLQKFNEEIKWMLQSGLVIKWKGKYWPKKDKCSSSIVAASADRTVKIGDMQGSFYILLLGSFVALIILLIEFFIMRRHKGRMIHSIKTFVTNHKAAEFWQQKQYPFLH